MTETAALHIDASFACPRCGSALPQAFPADCGACGCAFPCIDGIPWLLPEPALALAEWRHRLRGLAASLEQQAARYRGALGVHVTRTSTRSRLKLLASACDDHAQRLRGLLAPMDRSGEQATAATYAALGPVVPPTQGLTSYYANVHRDWAWGDAENRAAFTAVASALGLRPPARTLVLGAGAGRLAYDLHAGCDARVTIALDINPLFAAVARRMYAGEPVELYEFPVAPRDIPSHAVLRSLCAPAPARQGLHYVLADGLHAPFAPGSFDTVVTPWLVDVIDADLADIARAVNGLLAPGGRWVNTGTLFFQQRDAERCYATEEVREIVAECGFGPLQWHESSTPYLDSPASRHARVEEVVTFVAGKKASLPAKLRPPAADWHARLDDPVPLLPQVSARVLAMRVYAFVASLVDGRRSVRDIAQVLIQERLLPEDEALGAVKEFLRRLHDEATLLPNP